MEDQSLNGTTTVRLLRPVDAAFRISAPYGNGMLEGSMRFHKGIDFAVPIGTSVRAMADGAVFRAGWENEFDHSQGFGYRIWQEIAIDKERFYLWYGHLSKILVKEGDRIKRGQEIALSGNTGHSTGPHLHVQCRKLNEKDCRNMEFEEA